MRKLWIFLGIVALVVVLLGGYLMSAYNGFVSAKLALDQRWSDVEVQYQRRADIIPNLVSTVKGAANFEQKTFTDVTSARSAWGLADEMSDSREAKIAAANMLDSAIGRLLVTVEAYPTLQATQAFKDLMTQLEGTENRIAVARRDYNEAVRSYNENVQHFPAVLVARLFGFTTQPFFETAELPPIPITF